MAKFMKETRRWSSRYPNGTPMYPGEYGCTFVRFGGVWVMVTMQPFENIPPMKAEPIPSRPRNNQ